MVFDEVFFDEVSDSHTKPKKKQKLLVPLPILIESSLLALPLDYM